MIRTRRAAEHTHRRLFPFVINTACATVPVPEHAEVTVTKAETDGDVALPDTIHLSTPDGLLSVNVISTPTHSTWFDGLGEDAVKTLTDSGYEMVSQDPVTAKSPDGYARIVVDDCFDYAVVCTVLTRDHLDEMTRLAHYLVEETRVEKVLSPVKRAKTTDLTVMEALDFFNGKSSPEVWSKVMALGLGPAPRKDQVLHLAIQAMQQEDTLFDAVPPYSAMDMSLLPEDRLDSPFTPVLSRDIVVKARPLTRTHRVTVDRRKHPLIQQVPR